MGACSSPDTAVDFSCSIPDLFCIFVCSPSDVASSVLVIGLPHIACGARREFNCFAMAISTRKQQEALAAQLGTSERLLYRKTLPDLWAQLSPKEEVVLLSSLATDGMPTLVALTSRGVVIPAEDERISYRDIHRLRDESGFIRTGKVLLRTSDRELQIYVYKRDLERVSAYLRKKIHEDLSKAASDEEVASGETKVRVKTKPPAESREGSGLAWLGALLLLLFVNPVPWIESHLSPAPPTAPVSASHDASPKTPPYQPAEEVQQIMAHMHLTEYGTKLFLATRPEVVDSPCALGTQGCYEPSSHRIYLDRGHLAWQGGTVQFSPQTRSGTAAHELLHAYYAQLTEVQRAQIRNDLNRTLVDRSGLPERLRDWLKVAHADYENETHSVVGSEALNLSPLLERHYGKIFANRGALVNNKLQRDKDFFKHCYRLYPNCWAQKPSKPF